MAERGAGGGDGSAEDASADGHVFVDGSGRRALRLRLVIVPLAAMMSLAGAAALVSLSATTSDQVGGDVDVQVLGQQVSSDGPFAIDVSRPAATASPPSCPSLEGTVYEDQDLNGARQSAEPGVPGLVVTAVDAAGTVVGQTASDGAGRWHLALPAPRPVRLELSSPDLSMASGPLGIDSSPFVSFPPEGGCRVDAGIVWSSGAQGPGRPAMELGDRAWSDTDCDGLQDPGEPGMAGITVQLRDEAGRVHAETVTTATGEYRFGGLEGGRRYQVVATGAPPGQTPTRSRAGASTLATAPVGPASDGSQVPLGGADSDGVPDGAAATSAVGTGAPGTSDHSIDFGWASCPPVG